MRVLVVSIVLVLGLTVVPEAAADCSSPTIEVASISTVSGGAGLAVGGYAFGPECYDTGDPPPGQGALGVPMAGVELVLRQGASEWTLGRVDAASDYSFATVVTVPADAEPGPATVVARWGGRDLFAAIPDLTISPRAPLQPASPRATTTTATRAAPVASGVDTSATSSRSETVLLVLAAAAILAVAAGALVVRSRRRRRSAGADAA